MYKSLEPTENLAPNAAATFVRHLNSLGIPTGQLEVNQTVGGMSVADYLPLSELSVDMNDPINLVCMFMDGNRHNVGRLYWTYVRQQREAGGAAALANLLVDVHANFDLGTVMLRNPKVVALINEVTTLKV